MILRRLLTCTFYLLIQSASLNITANAMGQFFSYRELLIFNNDANSNIAKQQLELLKKSSVGVKERALKITIADKESPLHKKYKVDDRFTVILMGKDGYEKYRTNQLLEMKTLFSIIDAMPMRQSEMKKN